MKKTNRGKLAVARARVKIVEYLLYTPVPVLEFAKKSKTGDLPAEILEAIREAKTANFRESTGLSRETIYQWIQQYKLAVKLEQKPEIYLRPRAGINDDETASYTKPERNEERWIKDFRNIYESEPGQSNVELYRKYKQYFEDIGEEAPTVYRILNYFGVSVRGKSDGKYRWKDVLKHDNGFGAEISQMKYEPEHAKPYPLGATCDRYGVNFAVFSRSATKIELCVFDDDGKEQRFEMRKIGDVFCGFLATVGEGIVYAYRAYGENNPARGDLFNPEKLLFDPYSRKLTDDYKSVVKKDSFEWYSDISPNISWDKTIIYEAHPKGLTKQFPELGKKAGTFAALAEPAVIDYLKNLGVTAVELLPVAQSADEPHLKKLGLTNYWGYNTVAAFALNPNYALDCDKADDEMKIAVRALHRAGIEVILDVVYNHTAEGGDGGEMLCQRGLDNRSWYWLNERGGNQNWSGCGNTVNCSNENVLTWLLDNLRYWVQEFHIDGFRFDLASILAREPHFNRNGKFFAALYQDPILRGKKFIAEPWDIADYGYQLGNYPNNFAEWNDKFRDDVRRFWLCNSGDLSALATRFCASHDVFSTDRASSNSINFLTAHDGFTLADLTAYQEKHNEANGEENRDGTNANYSNNFGVEGTTNNQKILKQRDQARRAMLATLFLSNGTPMLLAGDEIANSQKGNNNAYCQDNSISWIDWKNQDHNLFAYTRALIQIREEYSDIYRGEFWQEEEINWFNQHGLPMKDENWHNPTQPLIQILLRGKENLLLLVNGNNEENEFWLPKGIEIQDIVLAPNKEEFRFPSGIKLAGQGIWVLQVAVQDEV
ncbi:MAG: glycogen debranching protein GlgX [Cardiobacteriaceae bacterium]|nr:glycogen debranching protein GlgX [Cardiobacteriaceae bacterium]